MAQVRSIFELSGKVGDQVFYKRNGKVFVRKNTSLNRERIQTDPNYAPVRENNDQLSGISSLSKVIRSAFAPYAGPAKEGNLHQRICRRLMKGEGLEASMLPAVLDELEWGDRYRLPSHLRAACHPEVDRQRGSFEVLVDSVRNDLLGLQPFTTHYRIQAVMGVFNPLKNYFKAVADDSGYLPFDKAETGSFILSGRLRYMPQNASVLMGIGVTAYQQVNRKHYDLVMGTSFALMGYE